MRDFRRAINHGTAEHNFEDRNRIIWLEASSRKALNTTALDDNNFYLGEGGIFDDDKLPYRVNFLLGERRSGLESAVNTKFLINAGRGNQTDRLRVEAHVRYENGVPVIMENAVGERIRTIGTTFTIATIIHSSEDTPRPIRQSNIHELQNMLPGHHYIIMEDLDLSLRWPDGWAPIPFVAASLDGNGKRIMLHRFNLNGGPRNIGLFSTVGLRVGDDGQTTGMVTDETSVLKNINLVLSNDALRLDITGANYMTSVTGANPTADNTVTVGLIAGRNAGVITNCAVVSSRQFSKTSMGTGFDIVDYNRTTFDKTRRIGGQQFNISLGQSSFHVRIGGLVGENLPTGVITNSRVMTDINVSAADGTSSDARSAQTLTLAGFVAENRGTISSSFYRDGNITNTVRTVVELENLTAGFVGVNYAPVTVTGIGTIGGRISGSYAMGVSDDLDDGTRIRNGVTIANVGTVIHGEIRSTEGSVAGFVHRNHGHIDDCYVNVRITAAVRGGASGFVMLNGNNGHIRNSFVNNIQTAGLLYFAFVSTDATAAGAGRDNIVNCVFVRTPGLNFSGIGFDGWTPIDGNQTGDMGNFDSFSIDEYASGVDPITVWQMRNHGVFKAPELVSANEIATSVRTWVDSGGRLADNTYDYATGFLLGQINYLYVEGDADLRRVINPRLITNGEQFNRYISEGSQAIMLASDSNDFEDRVFSENMRLVNNIDLSHDSLNRNRKEGEAERRLETYRAIFRDASFDGNNLNINNISMIVSATDLNNGLRSVGLFSKVEYATVKNVTLNFVPNGAGSRNSIDGSDANYVGGLAGASINSRISDVTLRGTANSTIRGRSIVGGLVGIAVVFDTPDSISAGRIQNIRTNVPVMSTLGRYANETHLIFESADEYISSNYYDTSIAGGVIGMITGAPKVDHWINSETSARNTLDVLRNDRDGNVRTDTEIPEVRVGRVFHVRNIGNYNDSYIAASGEIVGGLIGIVDEEIVVERANLVASANASYALQGKFYVGGIVGANFGTINNSNVRLTSGMTLESMAGTHFVFQNPPASPVRRQYGMTVGGAAGFNSGIIYRTDVATRLNGNNFDRVFRLGGIVGENMGGEVTRSNFGGTGIIINGGFIVGGLVGLNHGTGTVIVDNTIREGTIFGTTRQQGQNTIIEPGNFAGTITRQTDSAASNSIFGFRMATTDIITGPGFRYPFLDRYGSGTTPVGRELITGGFIGENRDVGLSQSVVNSNTSNADLPGTRKTGTFGIARNA
jgi:hypothetical protein